MVLSANSCAQQSYKSFTSMVCYQKCEKMDDINVNKYFVLHGVKTESNACLMNIV